MDSIKSIGVIVLSCFICLVLADIAGAVLVTVLPGPDTHTLSGHAGSGSVALYYVVWLVAGCFAGAFFASYDLEKKNGDGGQHPLVIFIVAVLLSAALILLFHSVGEMGAPDLDYSSSYYVPGNRNLTYTFFTCFLLVTGALLKGGKPAKTGKRA